MMLRVAADEARPLVPLAGGTDLFVTLNAGQKPAGRYLDLWRLDKLRGIDSDGKRRAVVRRARHLHRLHRVARRCTSACRSSPTRRARSAACRSRTAARSPATSRTARPRPTACRCSWPPTRRSCCARSTRSGRCRSPQYYTGYRQTVRRPDELIVRIDVDVPDGRAALRQGRHARGAGDLEGRDGNGRPPRRLRQRRTGYCARAQIGSLPRRRRARSGAKPSVW